VFSFFECCLQSPSRLIRCLKIPDSIAENYRPGEKIAAMAALDGCATRRSDDIESDVIQQGELSDAREHAGDLKQSSAPDGTLLFRDQR
jgi:hypothetical protein